MQYNGCVFYYTYRNCPNFFLFVDGQQFSTTKHNFIFDAACSISVHCLAISIWHISCCYGGVKCSRNHYLHKGTQSSQARHVLGDQPGGCRCVCWWLCDNSLLVIGKQMRLLGDQIFYHLVFRGYHCFLFLLSYSVIIKPYCYFSRSNARDVSSIQASPRQKENLWSNHSGSLDYRWSLYNQHCLTFLDRPLNFKESKDILLSYFSFFCFAF